jgi:hypothetical protein
MPVCSPYAVFRAQDLAWSVPPPRPVSAQATTAASVPPGPRKRAVVIQGNLFQSPLPGRSGAVRPQAASRSTASRASP